MTKVGVGFVASVAVCACSVVLPDIAAAAPTTRYVATAGSDDTNDCLVPTAPCRTVQHAVDTASPGDTVSIGTGTYDESVRVLKSIALRGASATDTSIVGGAGQATPGITVVGLSSTLTDSIADLAVQDVARAPGIAAQNVDLTVTGVRVVHSQVGLTGYAGSLTVADSEFTDNGNTVGDDVLDGGGILVASRATIVRSTVSANTGPGLEAIHTPDNPPVTVRDSSVSANQVTGITAAGATLNVDNTTLNGNRVAGILDDQSVLTVQASTISDTHELTAAGSPEQQGGILQARLRGLPPVGVGAPLPRALTTRAAAAAPSVTITGSIVDDTSVPDCVGAVVDGGHDLSSDASNSCRFTTAHASLARTDPHLGEFGDHGGPTGNRVPAAGSAAIDAIPIGAAGCVPGATDQRGIARPQGRACDIGAVEVVEKAVAPTTSPTPPTTPTPPPHAVGTAPAGPAGRHDDPIARTGTPTATLTTWGAVLVLLGIVLTAAARVGRRPGRHRSAL